MLLHGCEGDRTFQNQSCREVKTGKGEESQPGTSWGASPGACGLVGRELAFHHLAGDPDTAGGCELCSWRVALLRALDRAACLRLRLLGRVCGESGRGCKLGGRQVVMSKEKVPLDLGQGFGEETKDRDPNALHHEEVALRGEPIPVTLYFPPSGQAGKAGQL